MKIFRRFTNTLKISLEKANTNRKKEILKNGFTKIKYVGHRIKRTKLIDNTCKEVFAYWRRGHWSNQKFGKNLNETKLLWIMPTIVNKEKEEPQKGHIYEFR